jgi:DNA-binding MarR family transcriptional regulator
MDEVKPHEYAVLNEIAHNSLVTQAGLSERMGIAVGSVNWYVKRLVQRGWVKVSHLDRTRLKYDLTPEGMTIFTQRSISYARDSLKVYADFRNKARKIVRELDQKGIRKVYIDGQDETIDILRLTCIEAGIEVCSSPDGVLVKSDGRGYNLVDKRGRTG